MARENFGEATERATPRRREEARREGKVARSHELTSALVLLAGIAGLAALGGGMLRHLMEVTRSLLSGMAAPATSQAAV